MADLFKNAKNDDNDAAYIVKPPNSCQGKGIFLMQNFEQIMMSGNMIVQEYLPNPYIIEGLKFDLRLYVLVTCCDPLRIYLYEDGLVRFATEPYKTPSEENLENMCMHLTNYAINKENPNFLFNGDKDEDGVGNKRSVKWFYNVRSRTSRSISNSLDLSP